MAMTITAIMKFVLICSSVEIGIETIVLQIDRYTTKIDEIAVRSKLLFVIFGHKKCSADLDIYSVAIYILITTKNTISAKKHGNNPAQSQAGLTGKKEKRKNYFQIRWVKMKSERIRRQKPSTTIFYTPRKPENLISSMAAPWFSST